MSVFWGNQCAVILEWCLPFILNLKIKKWAYFVSVIFFLWGATTSPYMTAPERCSIVTFSARIAPPSSSPGSNKSWLYDPQWPISVAVLCGLLYLRMSGQGNKRSLKSSHASLPKLCTLAWGVYARRKVTFF